MAVCRRIDYVAFVTSLLCLGLFFALLRVWRIEALALGFLLLPALLQLVRVPVEHWLLNRAWPRAPARGARFVSAQSPKFGAGLGRRSDIQGTVWQDGEGALGGRRVDAASGWERTA